GFRTLIWRCATGSPREVEWGLVSGAPSASSTSLKLNPRPARALASRLFAGNRLFMTSSSYIAVNEESQIGSARRRVIEICQRISRDETFWGKVAIVVTERARSR